jgi:uncharacterized BrkB/YihY/UPF0761 family membrane protein
VLVLGVGVVTQYLRRGGPATDVGAMAAIGVVYAAVWLALSVVLPHAAVPWTQLVPGAVVFGVGTQLLHIVTVVYLAGRLSTASELYSELGVAATVLLGLYFVARLVVGAAVVNAVVWQSLARGEERAGGRLDDRGVGMSEGTSKCRDTRS